MNPVSPPYSVSFDLGAVPDGGIERTLSPGAEELRAIARWLGVESLDRLTALIHLKRRDEGHYFYVARFEADLVQACVVTLGPVPAHLAGEFRRDFRVRPQTSAKRRRQAEQTPASIELTVLEDDESDWLDQHEVDLAAPILEELALALDPYPRAQGVKFETPAATAEGRESPFAVLERLRRDRDPASSTGKTPTTQGEPPRLLPKGK